MICNFEGSPPRALAQISFRPGLQALLPAVRITLNFPHDRVQDAKNSAHINTELLLP